jgi:4-aminobutyrate aminotransferase/(S)-3-amino-2-methylpropionate transaminase
MAKVVKYCHSQGLLILTAGTYGNVIRFLPPLVITDELLRDGLSVLAEGFATL